MVGKEAKVRGQSLAEQEVLREEAACHGGFRRGTQPRKPARFGMMLQPVGAGLGGVWGRCPSLVVAGGQGIQEPGAAPGG